MKQPTPTRPEAAAERATKPLHAPKASRRRTSNEAASPIPTNKKVPEWFEQALTDARNIAAEGQQTEQTPNVPQHALNLLTERLRHGGQLLNPEAAAVALAATMTAVARGSQDKSEAVIISLGNELFHFDGETWRSHGHSDLLSTDETSAVENIDVAQSQLVEDNPLINRVNFSRWPWRNLHILLPHLDETDLSNNRAAFHALADEALKHLTIAEFREAIEAKLTAKAQATACETTNRTKETPRLNLASAVQTFAEAAAKSSRRNTRHVFTEAELRDPDAVNRARDTLSDIEIARSKGQKISDEQRRAGNRAKAFIRKASQHPAA